MRFMMLVKASENQGPPPQAMMDAVERAAEQAAKEGKIVNSGGLSPMAQSTRVRSSAGKITVHDGPYAEAKEVVGGFATFEFASKEEAVESAVQFMELHRKFWPEWEGETEVRQVLGPEDFCLDASKLETAESRRS